MRNTEHQHGMAAGTGNGRRGLHGTAQHRLTRDADRSPGGDGVRARHLIHRGLPDGRVYNLRGRTLTGRVHPTVGMVPRFFGRG